MTKKILLFLSITFLIGIGVYYYWSNQVTMKQSALIPYAGKRELINNSSVIIKGTLNKILPSKWSNPNFEKAGASNIIQTDILIKVEDVYKNKPYDMKEITLRIDKGKVGNTTMDAEGVPDFKVGEELILFLSEDDGDLANPNENYYVLTGMIQGKFSLDKTKSKGSAKKFFSNMINEKSKKSVDSFELSTIKEEIKTTIDDLKKNPIEKMTKEEIQKNNEELFGK